MVMREFSQDRVEGMEYSPEKRPSFPDFSVVRAFVRVVSDQSQAELFAKRPEFVGVYDPVEYDREGWSSGFAGVLAVKDGAVEPHVKPMRGIFRH